MDEIIKITLANVPWVAPLLYLVYRQQQRIDLLEGRQDRMIEWFMEHSDMDVQDAQKIKRGS
jgi:hypothetical protein